jgi:hypothetical protein
MTQITLQSVIAGIPYGSPILLEVATFDESKKAKLRTYSRVQAFSDVSLIMGSFNTEFSLSIAVPQQFTLIGGIPQYGGEDIETLLAGMQGLDQILVDAEGVSYNVRVTQASPSHTGGQPLYYTVDVTLTQTDG